MVESLFNKVGVLKPTILLKRDSTQLFSCEFCEIFNNRTPLVAASVFGGIP